MSSYPKLDALQGRLEALIQSKNLPESVIKELLELWQSAKLEWSDGSSYAGMVFGNLYFTIGNSLENPPSNVISHLSDLQFCWIDAQPLIRLNDDEEQKALRGFTHIFAVVAGYSPKYVMPFLPVFLSLWQGVNLEWRNESEHAKKILLRLSHIVAHVAAYEATKVLPYLWQLFFCWRDSALVWRGGGENACEALSAISLTFGHVAKHSPDKVVDYLPELLPWWQSAKPVWQNGGEYAQAALANVGHVFGEIAEHSPDKVVDYLPKLLPWWQNAKPVWHEGGELAQFALREVFYIFSKVTEQAPQLVAPKTANLLAWFREAVKNWKASSPHLPKLVRNLSYTFALLAEHRAVSVSPHLRELLSHWEDAEAIWTTGEEDASQGFSYLIAAIAAVAKDFPDTIEMYQRELLAYWDKKEIFWRNGGENAENAFCNLNAFFNNLLDNKHGALLAPLPTLLSYWKCNEIVWQDGGEGARGALRNLVYSFVIEMKRSPHYVIPHLSELLFIWHGAKALWREGGEDAQVAIFNLLSTYSGRGTSFLPYCLSLIPHKDRVPFAGITSHIRSDRPLNYELHMVYLRGQLPIECKPTTDYLALFKVEEVDSFTYSKQFEISRFKQNHTTACTATNFSHFIAVACTYTSRPGYVVPPLDYLMLFRGALLLKPLHCSLSPLRILLSYSGNLKGAMQSLHEANESLDVLRSARQAFSDESSELTPLSLWSSGLGLVWRRYRFNRHLARTLPMLLSQKQKAQQLIQREQKRAIRCLSIWVVNAVQRLGQMEVLASDFDYELKALLRWTIAQGGALKRWPWEDYAHCQQVVAELQSKDFEVPDFLKKLSENHGRYEGVRQCFVRWVLLSNQLYVVCNAFEVAERCSPRACLDALAKQVDDGVRAALEDSEAMNDIALELLSAEVEEVIEKRCQPWVERCLLSVLPDSESSEFWTAWVALVDAVLSHPSLGVQELHPPELEEGLLAWVASGLNEAQTIDEIWSLLMYQTAPLDCLSAQLPKGYSSWKDETDSKLAKVFQKDETYHCEHDRPIWEPFEVWQSQLAKLLPPLPTFQQMQAKLTETETVVLLYEAKQVLHALVVDKENVSCVPLSDANWGTAVQRFDAEVAAKQGGELIEAIEEGEQRAWHEHDNLFDNVCTVLKSCMPKNTEHLYLLPGTASNLPWEWALSAQGCAPVTRLVSVSAFLAVSSKEVTNTALIQGQATLQANDPDFGAMQALWGHEEAETVNSITETLLSLKDAQQVHYFGHGQTDAAHGGGNFLSMTSHKLFTRLFPLTDIRSEVINLSACYSAHSQHSIGLGHVLIGSGAQHVIGCLWQAEAVSLYCFNHLLKELSDEHGFKKSVFEQAQQQLRQLSLIKVRDWIDATGSEQLRHNAMYLEFLNIPEKQPVFAHPYFWAGYVWLASNHQ